jgi:hypothetical protein
MSRKEAIVSLAIPSENGWELWQRQAGAFELVGREEIDEDGNVGRFRAASHYAFPVLSVFTVPLWVNTDDPALLQGLVEMQLEKLGLKPDGGQGKLLDFKMALVGDPGAQEGDPPRNLVLATVLSSNFKHSLPRQSPLFFDSSPRFYILPGNHVILWKELGRIVVAITRNDQLVYSQALSSHSIDANAVQELKCLMMELAMEGVISQPAGIILWTEAIADDGIEALERSLDLKVRRDEKPDPVLPAKGSKLVPSEVALLRLEQKRSEKRRLVLLAAAAVYVALAAYLAIDYFLKVRELKGYQEEVAALQPKVGWMGAFRSVWDQVEDTIDAERYPVELFHRVQALLPPKGVGFTSYVSEGNLITIDGVGINTAELNKFGGKVFNNDLLADYEWQWLQLPTVDTRKRDRTATCRIQGKYKYGQIED